MISSSRSRLSYKDRLSHQKKRFRYFGILLLVLVLFLIFSSTGLQPWVLGSDSMAPGYPSGSRFLVIPVLKNSEGEPLRTPSRGDIVALRPPYAVQSSWILNVLDPAVRFITFQKVSLGRRGEEAWTEGHLFKRIIAVPGDAVYIRNDVAYVKGQGEEFFLSEFEVIGEGYDIQTPERPQGWDESLPLSGQMEPVVLGDNEYFVLGDNRGASNDSRYWGTLDGSAVQGRVLFVYWSPGRFGLPH